MSISFCFSEFSLPSSSKTLPAKRCGQHDFYSRHVLSSKARVPNSGTRAVLTLSGSPDHAASGRGRLSQDGGLALGRSPRSTLLSAARVTGPGLPGEWGWARLSFLGQCSPNFSHGACRKRWSSGYPKPRPPSDDLAGAAAVLPERVPGRAQLPQGSGQHTWPHYFASPGFLPKEEARGSIPTALFPLGLNSGPEVGWLPHWLVRPVF